MRLSMWGRHVLLTIALSFGGWALLTAWSGAAQADPITSPVPCSSAQVDGAPLNGEAAPEGGDPDAAEASAPDAPPTCTATPASDVDIPPQPVAVDTPVGQAPAVVRDVAPVAEVPPAVVPLPTPDPAVDRHAAANPAAAFVDPAAAGIAVTEAAIVNSAIVNSAIVNSAIVNSAIVNSAAADIAVTEAVVDPVVCSAPELGGFDASEIRAAAAGSSGIDRDEAPRNEPTPNSATPAFESAGHIAAPVSPHDPPAPVRMPVPLPALAPTAPAGPSAAASSGTSSGEAGQTDHADSIYAVLDARVAASLAQAALRASSGFAGDVVGGADDPGVRPG